MNSDIDWDHFAETACQHGIAPLVYYQLQQAGVLDLVPQVATEPLRRFASANAIRNTLLYEELHHVLKALQQSTSQVIALKGAALLETVYQNRALRPMNDIDLLVRKEDLVKIEKTLVEMDYYLDEGDRTKEWYREHYYQFVFRKHEPTPTDIHIEMHWQLERPSKPFTIDTDGLWERALPATIADVSARVLSPEDLLLHLCLHTCHHWFTFGVRPLCDIAETIRQYSQALDWGQMCTRASQWRVTPYVYLTLSLAEVLVEAAVPTAALDALKPNDFDVRLLEWAAEKTLAHNGSSPLSPNLAQFWKGRRLKEKVASVLETFSREVIAKNYPVSPTSYKVYWYYPARMRDLLRQYGSVLGHLVCRDQRLTALAEKEYHTTQLDKWLAVEWGEREF